MDPRPGRRYGSTTIPRPIATTSASTKDRARCRLSPTASSIPSAPKANCMRSISATGQADLERRHDEALQGRKGFFGAAGLAARRRRPGYREHRRSRGGDRRRSTRRPARCSWTATERRCELLFRGRCHDRRTAGRRLSHAQRPHRARSRHRPDPVSAPLAGAATPASVNAATPLVVGDLDVHLRGIRPGAACFRVDGSTPDATSGPPTMRSRNHYATSVYRDGILYGFHGRQEFGQSLRAVDLQTGKVRWSQERFRAGSITLAGDRLLILRETRRTGAGRGLTDAFTAVHAGAVLPATSGRSPRIADGSLYAAQREDADLSRPAGRRAVIARTGYPGASPCSLIVARRTRRRNAARAARPRRRRFSSPAASRIRSPASIASFASSFRSARPISGSEASRSTTPAATGTAAASSSRTAR